MHNTHVKVDRNTDPFSFNARVNATRIAISILMGLRSGIFAPCKRGNMPGESMNTILFERSLLSGYQEII